MDNPRTTKTPDQPPKPHGPKPPTSKQLRYLHQLALTTGRSFIYPRTSREASAAIQELQQGKDALTELDLDTERRTAQIERKHIARDRQNGGGATAYRDSETAGWGSSAHFTDPWAGHHTTDND